MKDLKRYMRLLWFNKLGGRDILIDGTGTKKTKAELALSTEHDGRKTNKRCNFCGKKGHIEKDCWKKNRNGPRNYNNRQKKFTGTCNHCGKVGHKEANCWKKFPNKNPRS